MAHASAEGLEVGRWVLRVAHGPAPLHDPALEDLAAPADAGLLVAEAEHGGDVRGVVFLVAHEFEGDGPGPADGEEEEARGGEEGVVGDVGGGGGGVEDGVEGLAVAAARGGAAVRWTARGGRVRGDSLAGHGEGDVGVCVHPVCAEVVGAGGGGDAGREAGLCVADAVALVLCEECAMEVVDVARCAAVVEEGVEDHDGAAVDDEADLVGEGGEEAGGEVVEDGEEGGLVHEDVVVRSEGGHGGWTGGMGGRLGGNDI